jgi:hypothetical protein
MVDETMVRAAAERRARALMRSGADRAVEAFRMAVRPIYGVTDGGAPDQLGSSVLLEIKGRKLLVTAAHVIDENERTSLYVGGADALVEIVLEFFGTGAPNGDRDRDHYDFAFAELPSEVVDALGPVKFIAANECRAQGAEDARRLFTVVGYPNSRNKPPYGPQTKVRGQIYQYSSTHRFEPTLAARLGIPGHEHLFIDHRKGAFDETGTRVNPIDPRGLSGGAILESFDFNDRDLVKGRREPTPQLAGITIARYPETGTLLGTKIDTIIRAIGLTLAAGPTR